MANRAADSAVVITGKPVNHVLHLLISVFCTCGFWVPVWLLLVVFGAEKRSTVIVDRYGQVSVVKAPLSTHQIIILCVAGAWVSAVDDMGDHFRGERRFMTTTHDGNATTWRDAAQKNKNP